MFKITSALITKLDKKTRGIKLKWRAFLGIWVMGLVLTGCAEMAGKWPPPSQTEEENDAPPQASPLSGGYREIPPRIGEKGYLLTPLAQDVYFFSTGNHNSLFVVTPKGVVITDPIEGKGPLLKKAVREVTERPIRFMIYSHAHRDHIGDAHLFAEEAQIIAHRDTGDILENAGDPNRPPPNVAFGSDYELTLGGLKFKLIYPGEGHGKGNIILHIPQRKILMLVDVATPKTVPFKGFAASDIEGQIQGIERALRLDFDWYVAGHRHRAGTKEELKEILEYYNASKKANREALKKFPIPGPNNSSAAPGASRLSEDYRKKIAAECARTLIQTWASRLMGVRKLAQTHCEVWTTFHLKTAGPAFKNP